MLASGSLKDTAAVYGISYPTVRLRLDRLIEKIKVWDSQEPMSGLERAVSLQVLRLENPPIATPVWAVVGEVRYEGVAGDGYLEMWSVFKDGRFFSRTLDQAGPMSRLSGASGWREFVLPFFSRADLPPPVALEVIRPATRDDRTGEQGPGLRRRVTGPVRPEGRRRRSTARSRPPAVAPLDLTLPAPGPRIPATVPSSRWTSGR